MERIHKALMEIVDHLNDIKLLLIYLIRRKHG